MGRKHGNGPAHYVDKAVTAEITQTGSRTFRLGVFYAGNREMAWGVIPGVKILDSKGKEIDKPVGVGEYGDWFPEDGMEYVDITASALGPSPWEKSAKGLGLRRQSHFIVKMTLKDGQHLPAGRYTVEPDVTLQEIGPDAVAQPSPAVAIRPGKVVGCLLDHKPSER